MTQIETLSASSIASPSSLLTLLHSLPPSLPHLDLLLVTMAEHGSLLVSREQVAEKFKVEFTLQSQNSIMRLKKGEIIV